MQAINLHYSETGQGLPLILLHGFPLNSTIWNEQARALGDHCRTIAPDLRGHGQSAVPETTYEMDSMADDVFRLMDTLGIHRATIIGHSMGGYVTLAAWQRDPSRFEALGLIGAHAWADSDEQRKNRADQVDRVFVEGSAAIAEIMMPRLFAPNVDQTESFIEQTRLIMLATKPMGIIGSLRGMAARPDLSAMLPKISVPVLIIVGDSDQIVPMQRAEAMASALPNAVLATIENAGHMPMLEQPQATALAIRNFLAEIHPHKVG